MAKKRENDKPIPKDDPARILPMTMEDVMHSSMIPYAQHVILQRALPRAEDGLKPVQRRILYTMMELGTTPDKPHRKCARIVGDCLGKYHPHGDSSVYGALVHMAQDFSMRATLVDGHGNFGSIDGDSAAAMRYTEARMTPLAMEMLRDIEKDTVPFRLNFDDSLKEPDLLPARYPNLLVNGANGIAVGLATNIPPHNFGQAVRAVIAQIEDPDISLNELMKLMPGPDFPTGGVLVENEEIRRGYETGRGKLQLRARVHIEDSTGGRKLLVITEIPFEVNKAAMLAKIQQLSEEKKAQLGMIYEIRDESDREGMRAVIELKKDADPDKVLAALYKYSDLQVTFGVNMVAIADGKPVQMSLKSMIAYFIRHQKNVVTRRTQFELDQARARAHILQGLMIAVDNLDEVIRLIRASKTPKEARQRLMEAFELDEIQAQAILDMRLQRLTNLEILALRKEYEELLKTIERLQGILKSEKKLMAVIRKEMLEISDKYGDPRRTTIEPLEQATVLTAEDEAPVAEDTVIAYTWGGALKRMFPGNVKKTPLPTLREDRKEAARFRFDTLTDRNLFIYTNRGNVFQLAAGKLNECKPKDRGQQLSALLAGLEDGEQAVFMDCKLSAELETAPDYLFVTKQGIVKRTQAAEFAIRSKKSNAMNIKDGDELLTMLPLQPDKDILLLTKNGLSIRFPQDAVSQQGRAAAGVKGIALQEKDEVIFAGLMDAGSELLLVTDRGYGKRIPAVQLEKQNRGGKGASVITFARTATNGKSVAGAAIAGHEGVELMIVQATSAPTVVQSLSMKAQKRFEKGTPLVMAIMEDVVTALFSL